VCSYCVISNNIVFVYQCNVLVWEQPNNWHDSLLTCITAVVHWSIPNRLTLRCSDLSHSVVLRSLLYIWIECYWRVISGQSDESLCFALLWLDNFKTPGCLVRKLTRASAIRAHEKAATGGTSYPGPAGTGSRENKSTSAQFFCNHAQNWWSLSPIAALVERDKSKMPVSATILKCLRLNSFKETPSEYLPLIYRQQSP